MEFRDLAPRELRIKVADGRMSQIYAGIRLYRTVLGIGADYDVRYTFHFDCVRCLELSEKKCNILYKLTYIEGEDPNIDAENINLKTTDIYKIYYRGPQVDLSTGIREAIVLNIPIAMVCSESCKGLCPVCGKNRNKFRCGCKTQASGLFTPVYAAPRKRGRKGPKK